MKIICIGLNYRKHAAELGWDIPTEPVVFLKPDSALLKNNKPFFLPDFSENMHYEVELVLRIGKLGKGISKKFAHRYYDAITLGIDMTARDLQKNLAAKGMPWEISKCFDGGAPLGEFIPVSEFSNMSDISFRLEINDHVRQEGNSSDMIFGFDQIIEYVSRFFTLKTGDLIFTGTPPGVGKLNRNDSLVAYLENKPVLDFKIK
jgi:acylpyruvate hydrolase